MPYLIPDTESPSLAIMGSHMCHILSQTQSHHRLLLWGHTCAVSYPRHRVTIACYYGVTHVPYFIPDTIPCYYRVTHMFYPRHIVTILPQTQSHHRLLLWGHTCFIAIMGSHMCRILSQTQSQHRLLLWGHTCAISYPRVTYTCAIFYPRHRVTNVPYLIPDT